MKKINLALSIIVITAGLTMAQAPATSVQQSQVTQSATYNQNNTTSYINADVTQMGGMDQMPNVSAINQSDDGKLSVMEATVMQTGMGNTSLITNVKGGDQTVKINQISNDNNADVTQEGTGYASDVLQTGGDGNQATVKINADVTVNAVGDLPVGRVQQALVQQTGAGNTANVNMGTMGTTDAAGAGNEFDVTQTGDNNTSTQTMTTGYNNFSNVNQNGTGNTVSHTLAADAYNMTGEVFVEGTNNQVQLDQAGNDNNANIGIRNFDPAAPSDANNLKFTQENSHNTMRVDVVGNDNTTGGTADASALRQAGTTNNYTLNISGNGNNIVTDQDGTSNEATINVGTLDVDPAMVTGNSVRYTTAQGSSQNFLQADIMDNSNTAVISQTGELSRHVLSQSGDNNYSSCTQTGNATATVTQSPM